MTGFLILGLGAAAFAYWFGYILGRAHRLAISGNRPRQQGVNPSDAAHLTDEHAATVEWGQVFLADEVRACLHGFCSDELSGETRNFHGGADAR